LRPARAVFINQYGSLGRIHGLDPCLRRLQVGHSPARGIPASRDPSPSRRRYPRMGMVTAIRMRPCVALWQQPGEGRRRLADSRNRLAGLSQAQSGTPTVLIDEFDSGPFKSSSYDIKGGATRATRPCLQLMHSYDSNSGFVCQLLLAPTEKSSGCPGLLRCNHAGRSCRKRVIPTIA
jgi:hypothetical protein